MKKLLISHIIFSSLNILAMQTNEKPPRPEVPQEISKEIIKFIMSEETLEKAIEAIKKYAIIDPRVETSKEFTNFLFNELSNKWQIEDLSAIAIMLDTECTKDWPNTDAAKKWALENKEYLECALRYAAEQGYIEKIQILLQLKVNQNSSSLFSDNPLIGAIRSGNPKIVLLLLSAGADPNQFDKSGLSALLIAKNLARSNKERKIIKESYEEIIELLITAGANPKRIHVGLWENIYLYGAIE